MKNLFVFTLVLSLLPASSYAGKDTPINTIAKEPVTMMDLGILKLNTRLSKTKHPGLDGATIGAKYNVSRGTIDIKVNKPVKKASRIECNKLIQNTKKIFLQPYGDKKVANIHYYFQHEGTGYTRRINWNDLANYVVITGIVLTGKNYQDSIYCQSNLMQEKITY